MLVWGQDLIRRFSDITIIGLMVIPVLGGLRACLAAMSLFCLLAVSAEFRPCHGPGDSADVWISFGNRSSDGPNTLPLGARADSALVAQRARGQNPENIFTPSTELIVCMDTLLGVRFDVPVEPEPDSTARARGPVEV